MRRRRPPAYIATNFLGRKRKAGHSLAGRAGRAIVDEMRIRSNPAEEESACELGEALRRELVGSLISGGSQTRERPSQRMP